jgi:hypothetical protein
MLAGNETVEGEEHDGMSHGLLRMLKPTWEEPGYVVCHYPGKQHHGDAYELQNHAGWPKIVRPKTMWFILR